MDQYLTALKKYAVFSGRASRKEYWLFTLVSMIVASVLSVLEGALLGGMPMLTSLYSIAILIPSLAAGVRRLHDTGRSGWWLFLIFIPIIGAITLIVFACMPSEAKSNEYGPKPTVK